MSIDSDNFAIYRRWDKGFHIVHKGCLGLWEGSMVLSEGMVVLREVIYGLFEAVRGGLAGVMV